MCIRDRAELLTKLGEALFAQSRFRQAVEAWKEGIDLYSQLGDDNGITRLYARYSRAEWHADDTPESLRVSLEALDKVPQDLDSPEMAGLLHEIGRAYYFNGQPAEAKDYCHRALAMAEAHQAVDILADTLTTLGVVYTDDPKLAYEYLDQAVRLAEANRLLVIAGRAHHNMSTIQTVLFSDLPGGREHLLKAAEIYRQHGNNQRAFFSLIGVISLSFQIGDMSMARQNMAVARELVDTLPEKSIVELELKFVEAVLMAFTGQLVQGREILPRMKALANERGNLQMASNVANMMILVGLDMDRYLGQHDLSEAIAASEGALVFAEQGFGDRVSARSQHGILMCRVGRLEEAHQDLSLVLELANPDFAPDAQSTLDIQFELAWAENRLDDAIRFQEELVDWELAEGRRWVYARDMISLADVYVQRGEAEDFGRAQKAYQTSLEIFTEMEILFYQNVIEERIRLLEEKTWATLQDSRKIARELSQAGKIQSSFLPQVVPDLEGWSISVVLEPARETSGDYYDFISLPENKLGILVADVTDKGAGAALFMASSRTLIRTYASLYPADPAEVIRAANDRLVQDTHEGLFVTLFYAVLDPGSGRLIFCNAGHNPPYLFRAGDSGEALELRSTGMTMGIFDNETWQQGEIHLNVGDVLLMFTDGVPDAENPDGEFYEQDRLVSAARRAIGNSRANAQQIQDAILADIHDFIKGAPRVDDLTLALLVRLTP
jgi:serine phosphatase RsbU (regulator of sigma subunit)